MLKACQQELDLVVKLLDGLVVHWAVPGKLHRMSHQFHTQIHAKEKGQVVSMQTQYAAYVAHICGGLPGHIGCIAI
jgi:hypothetical protein